MIKEWEGDDTDGYLACNLIQHDYEAYNEAIPNRGIPFALKSNLFPVQDRLNSLEHILVYIAIWEIKKYNQNGELLWETKLENNPELKAISDNYFDKMEQVLQSVKAMS